MIKKELEVLVYFNKDTYTIYKVESITKFLLAVEEDLLNEGGEAGIRVTEGDICLAVGRAFINENGYTIISFKKIER